MLYHNLLISTVAVGISMTLVSTPSMAQSPGNYVGVGAGISLQRDADITGTGINTSADTDTGFAGQLSVGHVFDNNMRAELELAYRRAGVDSLSGATNPDGSVNAWSGMVNGLYDFQNTSAFTPYLGIGAGLARVGYNGVSPVGTSRVDDTDTVFAYQGIAGVAYDLSEGLDLTMDFRHFRTADPSFRTDGGTAVDGQFRENRFMIGLRWSLGAPAPMPEPQPAAKPIAQPMAQPVAPPPPPAPVVEPAAEVVPRTYLVFFDWDRADLLPGSQAIVREAAANAGKATLTKIVTTGHADRSGSDAYNLRLSKRRAETVKAELIRLGVPAVEIEAVWKGELEPLVPTADGIRDPQNRRVEISFN